MEPRQWLESLQDSGIRPGLDRMRATLRALGQPHRSCRSIIVAGTNGKGSTAATMASILDASGYRTGLYTSPHLVDIRERWLIGREPVSEDLFIESIETLRRASARAGIRPTYFEALTLMAFILFERTERELAVLEVGMGGRLDAANVVRPIAALITPIGFDHMEYLGNTLRKIAREKAGVIHRGAVVLTTNRDPEVVEVLRARAQRFGCHFEVVEERPTGTPLQGTFQRQNVALAGRAAEVLGDILPRITPETIERGIRTTRWRGRLERLEVRGKEWWVDGCHNAHAARAVAPFIASTVPRPRLLVFGIMGDKDVREVAAILFPLFDRIITTEPYPPRSAAANTLAAIAGEMGIPATPIPDPRQGLSAALESPLPAIFVGGSLYLAGAAIEFLDQVRKD